MELGRLLVPAGSCRRGCADNACGPLQTARPSSQYWRLLRPSLWLVVPPQPVQVVRSRRRVRVAPQLVMMP
jgi:hypothetical protein